MTEKRFTVHPMIITCKISEDIDSDVVDDLWENHKSITSLKIELEDSGKCMTYQECVDLLNNLYEENKGIQDKVFKLLDWLETEKGISRKEIKEWWND